MFTVEKFAVCKLTKKVDMIARWRYKDSEEIKESSGTYNGETEALNILNRQKRSYLLLSLEKWVRNKEFIIEGGKGNNLSKVQALAQVKQALEVLICGKNKEGNPHSLETICRQLIKGEAAFRAILPGPQNPQREPAEIRLDQLIEFAKIELKNIEENAAIKY
jgi:hypothetical protein